MRKLLIEIIITTVGLCSVAVSSFAQGPPINTDTPIMLGLAGRGVRTFAKVISTTTLLQDGAKVDNPLNRQVTVWVTPLAVPYNLTDKFQIGGIFPLSNVTVESSGQDVSSFGLGDIRFFVKHLLYQFDRQNETLRVAAKAGIKLPSGDEKEVPTLGTGSTDYFFSTVAGWIKGRVGIYLEGLYNINTSKAAIDFGNSFGYNFALGYRVLPRVYETYPSPQLNAFLEVNGTTAGKNQTDTVTNENSGGTTVFLSPGLQYIGGRRWLIEASLQYPIINEPNGLQLATDWSASIGARVLLF